MFGSKKRKAKQQLDAIWEAMDMNCRNNYKEAAQEELTHYQEKLEEVYRQEIISQGEYEKRKQDLKQKQEELKGYDHKQHIGW